MIFLAIPSYGETNPKTVLSILSSCKKGVQLYFHTSSFLVDCFNECWCSLLNTPDATYWAMLHADVSPEGPWLETLVEELERKKLDVLSVVIPLKDDSRNTSTAVLDAKGMVHRLTLDQVFALPQTFTDTKEIGIEGKLLLNTGLWIAKVGPWMKEFPGFEATSQIVCNNGHYETLCQPEDWAFSCWAHEKGLKIGATRKVQLEHWGKKAWKNTLI